MSQYTLIDITNQLYSSDVYQVYAPCMYEPTYEKYLSRAKKYAEASNILNYGIVEDNLIKGVIILDQGNEHTAEIVGIAVSKSYRHKGIGKALIDLAMQKQNITTLFAETDDDAVDFYRRCGFKILKMQKQYGQATVTRYACELRIGGI